jgi:hypothetical protein
MNKFRVKKPMANLDAKKAIGLDAFTNNAETHTANKVDIDINAKPTRSFTVPLNEYELGLLKQISNQLDRSQRYISRKLLVKVLEQELNLKN